MNVHFIYCLSGSNPSRDAPCLELEFKNYNTPVSYPTDEDLQEYTKTVLGGNAAPSPQVKTLPHHLRFQTITHFISTQYLSECNNMTMIALFH